MTLQAWIEQIGVERAAELLGVTTNTVYQWLRFEIAPKPVRAYEMIEKTHGVLTWEGIYHPYVAAKLAQNNPNQLELPL